MKTIHKLDLGGLRADGCAVVWKGQVIKPSLMAVGGKNGSVYTAGIGIGQCIPATDYLILTPTVGFNYCYLKTHLDLEIPTPIPGLELELDHRKETFRSWLPYVGIDAIFYINNCWRLCGTFQYAWTHSHVTIDIDPPATIEIPGTPIVIPTDGLIPKKRKVKESSKGPIYGIQLERTICDCWVAHVAYGYNIALSKEKHGLRGYLIKAGIGRFF